MNINFSPEEIDKAKTCKSVEELLTLAKENGIDFTEAEATNLFAQLNPANGELVDSELEMVAGGCGECRHDYQYDTEAQGWYCTKCGKMKAEYPGGGVGFW